MNKAQSISSGFKILSMQMTDDEGKIVWKDDFNFNLLSTQFDDPLQAHLPQSLFQSQIVTRELTFSSEQLISDLKVVQRHLLFGELVEEFTFNFGFVIPHSTNTWSSTIVADDSNSMIPLCVLSGNLIVETLFFDKDVLLGHFPVKIFYE